VPSRLWELREVITRRKLVGDGALVGLVSVASAIGCAADLQGRSGAGSGFPADRVISSAWRLSFAT